MSREKQIEEMAEDLRGRDSCKHLPKELCNNRDCSLCEAEILYEAGYRKQSGNEIFEVLDSFTDDLMKNFLALCNYNDFNKLTLLTIGEVVDRLYDKYINDAISKMKGGITAESAIKAVQEAAHELKDTPPDDLLGIGSTMQF